MRGAACKQVHFGVRHIFGDVMGRVPKPQRKKLFDMVAARKATYRTALEEHKLGHITRHELDIERGRLGMLMLAELKEDLRPTEFSSKDYCYIHKEECFISPRSDSLFRTNLLGRRSGQHMLPLVGHARRHQRWSS